MSKQLPPSSDLTKLPTEAEREEQLIQDVLLLLENMVYREEATVKLILNCLYDAGSTNLINQKFQSRTLNRTLKWISKMSKPAFRMIAWQWFKKNCPKLITDWLRSQIQFKKVETPKVEIVVEDQRTKLNSLDQAQNQMYEVKQLRSQVKLLTGVLVVVVTVLTGSFVWAGYLLERSHLQVVEELQTQVKTLEASVNKH
ncbi:MAG: hypothetical protein VKL60_04435 [Sphaerospermopsis sp.]|jgi:hypothetical protein|uniref:Uncharacterized protein n=2 Tax=Sphaerospermopsis TaxID=752201 RepID=A0ABR9V999_9CYAN|nr:MULTISPECIES: hypothetical protein [Sphaerospermopsis]MEB3148253.1 hypothetical protein [Sphaerospermopsis sp.]BAZ80443.1 hypothetical protein NIES73_16980 [Sphaerospermopsis kisseleviana NIES-73]MBD2133027.1 hypothetical protein [Sphaerospermopsis sp. FACHB-1094]MBD2145796.1 hypothetical protein [Sphaerospermopsis sp. FACHB-1194]MBE9235060.1 hypothetical protein [Sphaerospermopsis aphanizomenoides LEGE 00250]